jgi:replication factor A3
LVRSPGPRFPQFHSPLSTLHPNTNPLSGGLGRVTQLRGDNATLDSDGAVTAHLNRDSHLTVGNWVEVVGKVNGDLSVRVLVSRDLGRDGALLPRQQREEGGKWANVEHAVDFEAVKAVVDATHRYKEIFYSEQ